MKLEVGQKYRDIEDHLIEIIELKYWTNTFRSIRGALGEVIFIEDDLTHRPMANYMDTFYEMIKRNELVLDKKYVREQKLKELGI